MAKSWDEIPSIDDLKMDWEYEPENPLGKRSTNRLSKKQVLRILGEESVPVKIVPIVSVKIVSKKSYEKGYLIDISENGLAVVLDVEMAVDTLVKVGLFLGKNKIISKGIVRNVSALAGNFRMGIEFIQLEEESVSFIKSVKASSIYKL